MIAKFISVLQTADLKPTADNIADILWLALQMSVNNASIEQEELPLEVHQEESYQSLAARHKDPPITTPIDADEDTETKPGESESEVSRLPERKGVYAYREADDDGDNAGPTVRPFRSPGIAALPDPLVLSRALRPLMRRVPSRTRLTFDEAATVHAIAVQHLARLRTWVPVQLPERERWLDVALVIDSSRSMALWYSTISEWKMLLERLGAFRNVRVWSLVRDDDKPHLYLRPGIYIDGFQSEGELHNIRELLDPTGRRLILLMSDCVSEFWRHGLINQPLATWGKSGPVAIIQMLSPRFWRRSALGDATLVYLHTMQPGISNTCYVLEEPLKDKQKQIPVPVISFKKYILQPWAALVAGTEPGWVPGYAFTIEVDAKETSQPNKENAPESPVDSIEDFLSGASPGARRLLGLMAVAPITLPIVRLLQHTMLPASDYYDVAEVFLSGLLEQKRNQSSHRITHPDEFLYDFIPGVRDILMNSLPISISIQVLIKVGDFITEHYGQLIDIRSWLDDMDTATPSGNIQLNALSRAFASIAADFLQKITPRKVAPERIASIGDQKAGGLVEASSIDRGFPREEPGLPEKEYDFYISHAAVDTPWAGWITEILEDADYKVIWPRRDFLGNVSPNEAVIQAIGKAHHVLLLLAPDYLYSPFAENEVDQASILYYQKGEPADFLIPIIVRRIEEPKNYSVLTFLKQFIWMDLTSLDDANARQALLERAEAVQARPTSKAFPRDTPSPIPASVFYEGRSIETTPALWIVFAHQNKSLVDDIQEHLSKRRRQHPVRLPPSLNIEDDDISPYVLEQSLEESHILIYCNSPHFMASDIAKNTLLPVAKDAKKRVIGLYPHPIDSSKSSPTEFFAQLSMDNTSSTRRADMDEIMQSIFQAIDEVQRQLQLQRNAALARTVRWLVPFGRNSIFIGYNELLVQLYTKFWQARDTNSPALQALCGMAGSGKTQIAIEYAYHYRDHYETVLWIDATNDHTWDQSLHAAVSIMYPGQTREEPITTLRGWLQAHARWLLILDHVSDMEVVRRLQPHEGRGHILLTTRTQIIGRIARRIVVKPMAPDEGALLLLRHIDNDNDTKVTLNAFSQDDMAAAHTIVQLCEGLPLALDQAGTNMRSLDSNPSAYLKLYQENRIKLLSERHSTYKPDYPDSVATALSESITRCKDAAANLLRFCAFLDREAIAETLLLEENPRLVLSLIEAEPEPTSTPELQINKLLSELLSQSLISRGQGKKVFRIHLLVQVVIQESKSLAEPKQWVEKTAIFLDTVFPDGTFSTWDKCKLYITHAQVCLKNIRKYQVAAFEATALLARVGAYFYNIGAYDRAEDFLKEARKISDDEYTIYLKDYRHLVARIHLYQGKLALARRNYKVAEQEVLYAQAQNVKDQESHVEGLCTFGQLCLEERLYGKAATQFREAESKCEGELGREHPLIVIALNGEGSCYLALGRHAQAEEPLRRAYDISRKIHSTDHPDTALCLHMHGILFLQQNHLQGAEKAFENALKLYESTVGPDHPTLIGLLKNYSMLLEKLGDLAKRDQFLKRAVEIEKKHGIPS